MTPSRVPTIPEWYRACCEARHAHGCIHAMGATVIVFVCADCERTEGVDTRASLDDEVKPWPVVVTREKLFALVRRTRR